MTEQKFLIKMWWENYVYFEGQEDEVKATIEKTKRELAKKKNPTKISYTTLQE
jgi:hypothetical protein